MGLHYLCHGRVCTQVRRRNRLSLSFRVSTVRGEGLFEG